MPDDSTDVQKEAQARHADNIKIRRVMQRTLGMSASETRRTLREMNRIQEVQFAANTVKQQQNNPTGPFDAQHPSPVVDQGEVKFRQGVGLANNTPKSAPNQQGANEKIVVVKNGVARYFLFDASDAGAV